ncbi:MAG: LysR substrate-binding domain-containing protein [Planctomycetota bacterium]|nr:LysR substrate-binding domain-containing protein [Planctomycetota bacterium]
MERPSIRQLECALAVERHANFSRAAEALYLSQPALSNQIKQLEAQLGLILFERGRHGARTTPEGQAVLARARVVLSDVDALSEQAASLAAPFQGDLRLGAIPTVAPYLLPTLVPAVREVYPDLRLFLREERTAELVRLCLEGQLDILLLALDVELGGLTEHFLFEDPFLLAARKGHPATRRKLAREEDLNLSELLLLDDGHCLREHALSQCNLPARSSEDDFRASSLGTLVQMVASGLGVTLLPSIAADVEATEGLELRPFPSTRKQPGPGRRIGLAWRPTSPRASQYEELAGLFSDVLEPLAQWRDPGPQVI